MSPYRGSHERENAADWTLFSSVDYTEQDRFLTPNVEYEHGYDQDITPLSVDDAAEVSSLNLDVIADSDEETLSLAWV